MTDQPTISAIITYHNERLYIREALESVLNQTYPAVEVIVVDDGSEERLDNLLVDYSQPIRYLYQANAGVGTARNSGVDAATGEYIAFLDGDDMWPSERLARQYARFQSNPAGDIVAGYARQFISPELDDTDKQRLICPDEPMRGLTTIVTFLIRRQVFDQVGPFTTDLKINHSVDWIARLQEQSLTVVGVDAVVLKRRLHTTNHGLTAKNRRIDMVWALKATLDRRRRRSDASD
jgi:glycosyltransferase involved in cell wall biosynthesis